MFKVYLKSLGQLNKGILLTLCLIATVGFLILYSAAGENFSPWASKQILRFGVGVVLLSVMACVDLRFWLSQSYLFYALSVGLLIIVEVMGKMGMGAERWIDLYVFLLQPSEIVKITLIMALARYFHGTQPSDMGRLATLVPPFLMILFPAILVLRQPDLGTMLIFAFGGLSVFVVAGLRVWQMVSGAILAGLSLPLMWSFLYDYQKNRVLTFLNPERDPLGSGYHILQSKIALGSGGLFGKGFGQGTQSHLNFLPEKQTDFIFSMLCEEFGIFGGFLLILAYSVLVVYGYRISLQSRNLYGRYLGIGLTTLFFLYVFINISMVMGLVPVVGVPLPLVSYGGTAMLTVMMVMGLLMSISLHRNQRIGRV